jgi:hypothetical protein
MFGAFAHAGNAEFNKPVLIMIFCWSDWQVKNRNLIFCVQFWEYKLSDFEVKRYSCGLGNNLALWHENVDPERLGEFLTEAGS